MKMFRKALVLASGLFLMAGCQTKDNESPYNPYKDRGEVSNIYNGDGNDFSLSRWYASEYGLVTIEENSTETKVNYTKEFNHEYVNLYTTVMGRFADFTYINILAKGVPGKSIAFRMFYGEGEDEKHNVLGNDVSFSLSEDYAVHTLKVRGTLKTRMDLLTRVCIYPEIGSGGSDVDGEFTFQKVWFSKEVPENSTLENPGVDDGDTSVSVNGWRTEGWTMYTLYSLGTSKTGVKYSKAADWGYIEKEIEIPEGHNGLSFSFQNLLSSNKLSVTCIRFLLRGDVAYHVSEGVEYEYDVYYEATIYSYDLTKEDEVKPDENGITTLDISLEGALETIGEHHQKGYKITLLIESNPGDTAKYHRSRDGNMVITDVQTKKGSYEKDSYSQYGMNTYKLTDKDGVDKNITYENVKGNSYFPRVVRKLKTKHGSTITLKVRNNGENSVRFGVHAGIYIDARSDALNNMFYPLYKVNGKNADGYYMDGHTIDIASGSIETVVISVDEQFEEGDVIDCLQFLIDNCYGDSTLRSGNVDIMPLEIA